MQLQVLSKFMPTSRRLVQFSDGKTAPANAKIVYIDGAFDLFHVGHIKVLQVRAARVTCHCLSTSQAPMTFLRGKLVS